MKKLLLLSLMVLFGCEKDPIQYTLSVQANPLEGGLVNPSSGTFNSGETIRISASPYEFWEFDNWSGGWAGSSLSVFLTMDGDKTIKANFTKVDNDEDGVLNYLDNCQSTAKGLNVNSQGCALSQLDSDQDGVTDDIDLCPNEGNAAIINSSGCKVNLFYRDSNGITIKMCARSARKHA